jgi:hypothetical protein
MIIETGKTYLCRNGAHALVVTLHEHGARPVSARVYPPVNPGGWHLRYYTAAGAEYAGPAPGETSPWDLVEEINNNS